MKSMKSVIPYLYPYAPLRARAGRLRDSEGRVSIGNGDSRSRTSRTSRTGCCSGQCENTERHASAWPSGVGAAPPSSAPRPRPRRAKPCAGSSTSARAPKFMARDASARIRSPLAGFCKPLIGRGLQAQEAPYSQEICTFIALTAPEPAGEAQC